MATWQNGPQGPSASGSSGPNSSKKGPGYESLSDALSKLFGGGGQSTHHKTGGQSTHNKTGTYTMDSLFGGQSTHYKNTPTDQEMAVAKYRAMSSGLGYQARDYYERTKINPASPDSGIDTGDYDAPDMAQPSAKPRNYPSQSGNDLYGTSDESPVYGGGNSMYGYGGTGSGGLLGGASMADRGGGGGGLLGGPAFKPPAPGVATKTAEQAKAEADKAEKERVLKSILGVPVNFDWSFPQYSQGWAFTLPKPYPTSKTK